MGQQSCPLGADVAVTQILVVADPAASRGFWVNVLGAEDDFDHYWRGHLDGPVNTVKAAWPHMVAQRDGKIILTTSVAGLFGLRGQAPKDL